MGKKRRAWWIVGGVATAFALFVLTVFLIDYNSTDARIERAVAQIAEEYGFKKSATDFPGYIRDRQVISDEYSRTSVDSNTVREIEAILRDACISFEDPDVVLDGEHVPFTVNKRDPWQDANDLIRARQSGGRIAGLLFIPYVVYSAGGPDVGEVQTTYIVVYKYADSPSLWEKIKGLWPW